MGGMERGQTADRARRGRGEGGIGFPLLASAFLHALGFSALLAAAAGAPARPDPVGAVEFLLSPDLRAEAPGGGRRAELPGVPAGGGAPFPAPGESAPPAQAALPAGDPVPAKVLPLPAPVPETARAAQTEDAASGARTPPAADPGPAANGGAPAGGAALAPSPWTGGAPGPGVAVAAGHGTPSGEGPPGEGGASFGLLRDRIQSRTVYPGEAVRRGQQGEVLLRIRIGPDGSLKDVRIGRSSGVRLLDEAARRGVIRAVPLPPVPGWVEVPVKFRFR